MELSSRFFPLKDAPHVYMHALTLCRLTQSYQYPNLSEGADSVSGQLRGDKECPFIGVTRSGRVWRKVPKSDTRSVPTIPTSPVQQGIYSPGLHSLSRRPQVQFHTSTAKPLFGQTKILLTLLGLGSAALTAAAFLSFCKMTQISHKE